MVSIGIDIGTATTHFAVSTLSVGVPADGIARKPEILERTVLYRSPISFTPYSDDGLIDLPAVEDLIGSGLIEAGVTVADIDTGAVICTGEAARRANAGAIAERVSELSGEFVCVAAGHDLEARLGAHGSGAVELSTEVDHDLFLLDVGGGTTKRTQMRAGRVLHTAALNVGARLVVWDDTGAVIRVEPAGRLIADAAGVPVVPGEVLTSADRRRLADVMAELQLEFLGVSPLSELARKLLLTNSELSPLPNDYYVTLSGGVSEFVASPPEQDGSDLGRHLAAALVGRLDPERLIPAEAGIRATVLGTSQYSTQVSGSTIYVSEAVSLPLVALPVLELPRSVWTERPEPDRLARMMGFGEEGQAGPRVYLFPPLPAPGYGMARAVAVAVARVLADQAGDEVAVLVFQDDVAAVVGAAVSAQAPHLPLVCVDQVELENLDLLDIGAPVDGSRYLPVVVRSLIR